MAEGGGGKKVVASCSCLSMVFFLILVILIRFVVPMFAGTIPPEVTTILDPYGFYVSNACCCLSGVGLVIGIILLLLGGKKGEDAEYD